MKPFLRPLRPLLVPALAGLFCLIPRLGHAQGGLSSQALRPATRAQAAQVGRDILHGNPEAKLAAFVRKAKADNPHGNMMAVLFLVFRESIQEQNEDKKYWLQKLQNYNDIGEALGNYVKELNEAMNEMGGQGGSGGGGCGSAASAGAAKVGQAAVRVQRELDRLKRTPAARSDLAALEDLEALLRRDLKIIQLAGREFAAVAAAPTRTPSRPGPGRTDSGDALRKAPLKPPPRVKEDAVLDKPPVDPPKRKPTRLGR